MRHDPPHLGLVCITRGPEVRYRTVTRTRLLAMAPQRQLEVLRELYRSNLQTLFGALDYCSGKGICLYRVTSALFPQVDHPAGQDAMGELAPAMASFGRRARRLGIRVVIHPDQFVVLNSESPRVVEQSIGIMEQHAQVFDLLKLPCSPWSAMILHGGKAGRAQELIQTILTLPKNIRRRLVLENDESAYGAEGILDICRAANVPMVFDIHHHAVHEKLDSYEHPGIPRLLAVAARTWPRREWQMAHLSNGLASFADPRHSDLITHFPSVLLRVPWIEIEAKAKEEAIAGVRGRLES